MRCLGFSRPAGVQVNPSNSNLAASSALPQLQHHSAPRGGAPGYGGWRGGGYGAEPGIRHKVRVRVRLRVRVRVRGRVRVRSRGRVRVRDRVRVRVGLA